MTTAVPVRSVRVPYRRAPWDFYPTHPAATRALLSRITFDGSVWEPACGAGDIARVLESAGHRVVATDLRDHGYGDAGVDFLKSAMPRAKHIVTNPPYRGNLHGAFVNAALRHIRQTGGTAALLLPLYFLTGQRRGRAFQAHPPAEVLVLDHLSFDCERLPDDPHAGPVKVDVAWCVWHAGFKGPTRISWLRIDDFHR